MYIYIYIYIYRERDRDIEIYTYTYVCTDTYDIILLHYICYMIVYHIIIRVACVLHAHERTITHNVICAHHACTEHCMLIEEHNIGIHGVG